MAAGFDGISQFLTVPVDSAFEFGTGDFTIAHEISFSSLSGKNDVSGLCLGRGANGGTGSNLVTCSWWFSLSSTSISFFRYDGVDALGISRPFTFALNTSYRVLVTRLGTSLRVFVNEQQQGESVASTMSFNRLLVGGSQDLHVGRYFTGNAAGDPVGGVAYRALWFNGKLSEVGIWKAGLTNDEIVSLARGYTPDQIRPQSMTFYAPLVRSLQDLRNGLTFNNNGATVADHPRIIT